MQKNRTKYFPVTMRVTVLCSDTNYNDTRLHPNASTFPKFFCFLEGLESLTPLKFT